ncbi:hypothetical protein KUV85_12595 [Nocardioides panacisoli]|uniref:hypothetical protein n=1 Tax=Nocardioides panacisoli TaxID=627624 RepID=UPI001C62B89E|nr:hypothetical protein [Nocardioides panacisoli]QYJ03170.1 hypothetical protein KUV85_12595 [Nocardioides panacisoli]
MATFALIYTGGMGMEMDPEDQQKVMDAWGAWYATMGDAIIDGGAPFGDSKHLAGEGVVTDGPLGPDAPTGYTVIAAESLDAAAAACADHPHLHHGGQVQVFTCIDMSGQ